MKVHDENHETFGNQDDDDDDDGDDDDDDGGSQIATMAKCIAAALRGQPAP